MNLLFVAINLWNPQHVTFWLALLLSFLLGLVHGATPDEHTWPITFSYAVGSYSTRKGMKAGLIFSSGFTLQRAFLSELAYFALVAIFTTSVAFGITYVAVGIAMAAAGYYLSKRSKYFHWHYFEKILGQWLGVHEKGSRQQQQEFEHKLNPITSTDAKPELREVPLRLAFIHGLIAGFGFGAFALILVTVMVPAMPNAWVAWLPGTLFGLGTMIMQIIFGAFFGTFLTKTKKLTQEGVAFVSKYISRSVLFYGGIAFVVAGLLVLAYPNILNFSIQTGIKIHNLDSLDIGFFLVIFVVVVIGIAGYVRGIKLAEKLGYVAKPPQFKEVKG
jgi:threonine/homoserine/homoserine lactone efflux protein